MNKVVLIGRLTRDPELRYTGSNLPVATFAIAVNRPFSNQAGEREADFINIVVWRKQAEGRIQTRSYDDQNGQKRYITEVIADNVEFLGSRNSSTNSNNMSAPASKSVELTPYDFGGAPEPKGTDIDSNPYADFGASIEISDDELPF